MPESELLDCMVRGPSGFGFVHEARRVSHVG